MKPSDGHRSGQQPSHVAIITGVNGPKKYVVPKTSSQDDLSVELEATIPNPPAKDKEEGAVQPLFSGEHKPSVVCIGGGHGLARTITSLLALGIEPTTIISVADDGGSTGQLRSSFNIPAVGDIRRAMRTLMPDSDHADVFAYRIMSNSYYNHAIGNLMLLGAMLKGHTLVEAIEILGKPYGMKGRVLPCTEEPITLRAKDHGHVLSGQVAVQNRRFYGRLESVWAEPNNPKACPQAVEAISKADFIIIGPGSLYTSIIPNFLVPDIAEATIKSISPTLFIANTSSQAGETDNLLLQDHVDVFAQILQTRKHFDVLAHEGDMIIDSGNPLGTEVDHDCVHKLLCRPIAISPDENKAEQEKNPTERKSGGHSVQRLTTALAEWIQMYTVESK